MKGLEKRLIKKLRGAIMDFSMIEKDEIVLVGVSGGKDSMVLLYLLNEFNKIIKDKFVIKPIYIFADFLDDAEENFQEKHKYIKENLGLNLEKVHIKLPNDSKLKEGIGQSCQWCAYARRIAMFKLCEKYSATKIAFGHHLDDIVVTTFMNMIEGKKLKIMPPKNKMSKGNITFIRPLAYMREKEILSFAKQKEIPFGKAFCPVGENTMRNKIKLSIIRENEKLMPKYTENIFWSFVKDFREKYEKDGYSM